MSDRLIRVGHSPDPDDAFMFYGLSSGKVKLQGIRIRHVLEDIQSLNRRALKGDLEVTAISAHAYPYVAKKYWVLDAGASMGNGYGPILVSKSANSLKQLRGKKIAHPGELTTANLLLNLYLNDYAAVELPFDEIIDAVLTGKVEAGVLIHEGQITYAEEGLKKILDFGKVWAEETNGLPLPLGLDVVRRDLGVNIAREISFGLKESIRYGYTHQSEAIPYALKFGRGIDQKLGEKFVKMYVNDLTVSMGDVGKAALELLYKKAAKKKLIPQVPELQLI
jgi:1,4-dihydroxy-6-naphthoate synthase